MWIVRQRVRESSMGYVERLSLCPSLGRQLVRMRGHVDSQEGHRKKHMESYG